METPKEQTGTDQKMPSGGRMVLAMGLIGFVASVLLVSTFVVTDPYIQANLAAYLEEAIGVVLPDAATRTTYFIDGDSITPGESEGRSGTRVFAGYAPDSTLSGIVIEAQGQGYADIIRLIYSFSFDCDCIVGLKVLESRETPGLGEKIENDEMFLSNFRDLDVRWSEEKGDLDGELELIKRGERTERWQIHGISGATISSRAITDILNASNARVMKVLHEQKQVFSPDSDG